MKQTWMIFLLVILAALPALAATITVNTPVANATLQIGVSNAVTWTFAGLPNTTKIKIVLWCNNNNLGVIVQDLAIGQGSYDWKVGTYPVGPGYSVRVRTMDNSVSGFSGSFSLSAKPGNTGGGTGGIIDPLKGFPVNARPCMAVTSPKAGDTADPYNIVSVKWSRSNGLDANVSVTLMRTGKGAHLPGVTLAASAPNNGGFNWDPVPVNPNPGVYRIKVRTLDGKCEALSAEFTMKEQGGIELLSPKGGEVWENGTSHAVTWKRLGNIQKVDILFNRASSVYKTLAKGVDAKLGTVTCVFEKASWEQGNPCHYTLFIIHSGGGSSNISGCITLTGNPDLAASASFTPTMANVGTNLTFAIKIENKGVVRSQPCQGDFYVNGVIYQAFPVPAVDPGATATVSRIWKLACPGTVKIIIDPGQANIDTDKTNNVWEKPICTN